MLHLANGALQPTEVDITAAGTSNGTGEMDGEMEQEEVEQEEENKPSVVSYGSEQTNKF